MLSLGMFSALAAAMAVRRRGLLSGSPPPALAAMVISLISWVKILPRLASRAPFLCLIVAHFEWPDMRTPNSFLDGILGQKAGKKGTSGVCPQRLSIALGWGRGTGPGRRMSAGVVVPFGGALFAEGGGVFEQDPALADEVVDGFFVAREVVVAAGVALGDGGAGIAQGFAFGCGFWEGEIRAEEGDALIGGAGGGSAEVPSGVGGEGHGDFGEVDAGALV